MNKKIALIFGITGQDGSYLAEFLLKKKYKVIGTDRRSARSNFWRLRRLGIENQIIFEDKSRNTYENIIYSKKIANPKINENWLLITSASHMKRALLIADKNNWKLIKYDVMNGNIQKNQLLN